MLDINSTIQDLIDYLKIVNSCVESVPYLEGTITIKRITLGELAASIDDETSSYNPEWAAWMLRHHSDQMTSALQLSFIKRITMPMIAFQIYRDCFFLSDEADIELVKIFEGKLPNAEQQLKDGIQIREKDK